MLEIKNVTKIYKTKGGVDTKALDGVSITFAETGLVFLLGKSGSGKSTLLNICGGLDAPTSGEIVVKGKRSKDFTGSDFDSYRNTFVGFIFQEYNILDEFNVEDNIALALELQGKPKDKQRITELLQSVEMGMFAKRKPNTLSGGQKQRLAIARALIKEPQIIMADEPTGALDSATGKQVLETLKNLSKTRLVIIVSHDREFAETYGDRIVELSDGKIISDVTKSEVPARVLDENISVVGENTLKIKKGTLTNDNLKAIRDFVLQADGDVIISRGEKEISAFSKAARITCDGATERFNDTDTSKIEVKQYSAEDSKLIRSRLPAGKAIKIGASGLKLKPIRLLFTILLSVIAFTMFGLFSTLMLYDGEKVAAKSFALSDYDYMNVVRNYEIRYDYGDGDGYSYWRRTGVTEAELNELKEKYSSQTFGYYDVRGIPFGNVKLTSKSSYWNNNVQKCAYVPAGHTLLNNLVGSYPKDETEICISSYLFDVLKNSDLYTVTPDKTDYSEKDKYTVTNKTDIIGKYLIVNVGENRAFKVSGVYDSGKIPAKYDGIKEANSEQSFILEYEFMNYMNESMNYLILVSENFAQTYNLNYSIDTTVNIQYFDYIGNNLSYTFEEYDFRFDGEYDTLYKDYYFNSCAKAYGGEHQLPVMFFNGKNSVSGNEVVLDLNECPYDLDNAIQKQLFDRLKAENPDMSNLEAFNEVWDSYNEFCNVHNKYTNGYTYENGHFEYFTQEQLAELRKEINEYISNIQPIPAKITIDGMTVDCTIVGVYEDSKDNYMDGAYYSQEFIDEYLTVYKYETWETTNYVPTGEEKYEGVFIPYDHTEAMARYVINTTGVSTKNESDLYFELNSELYQMVELVNETVNMLKIAFLAVGIVFAVFASLLMFNFISMSISSKRKEIGILRAVGARGADVFRIFFAESGIIIGICTVLAMVLSVVVTSVINNVLKAEVGLEVTLFMFGFASAGIMIGIALLVAFIATFLPVFFAARKKPVEAIRAL